MADGRHHSTRTFRLLLVGALALAGCGQGQSTNVGKATGTTIANVLGDLQTVDPKAVPDLSSDFLDVAVVDRTHALVIEQTDGYLSSVALADDKGELRPLPGSIPRIGTPRIVGNKDGYVIVGLRCPDKDPVQTGTGDAAYLCTSNAETEEVVDAQSVAVGLDISGAVTWSAVGPWTNPARFGGLTPTTIGALVWIGDLRYTIDEGHFERLGQTTEGHDEFIPCALRDGRFAAFVADYNSKQDDSLGGHRRLFVRSKGKWTAQGRAQAIPEGGLITASCTVGGLVAETSLFTGGSTQQANLADVGLESVAGITAEGALLMDRDPRAIIDPKSGRVIRNLATARYVSLSWDGRTMAQITDDRLSIGSAA